MRPVIPMEAKEVYEAFCDIFDYEDICEFSVTGAIKWFMSFDYNSRFMETFKLKHPYSKFLDLCEMAMPAMIHTAKNCLKG